MHTEDEAIDIIAHDILGHHYDKLFGGAHGMDRLCAYERFIASWCESVSDYAASWSLCKHEFMVYAFTKWRQREDNK